MEEIKEIKQTKLVKIIGQFNCQSFPLDDTAIEVSLEDLEQIGITKCFDVENNCVIDYDNSEDLIRQHQQELRVKREPLLKAFDIYKSNVNYGVITETELDHNAVVAWYHAILDLDEEAINNVPNVIERYIGVNMIVYDSKGDI